MTYLEPDWANSY